MSGRGAKTAALAVTAAALALAGLSLAAWARWSAGGLVDGTRSEAATVADRVGALVSTAIATARVRAEGLAAMPTVRAAIETDVATVRDMARAEGFVFTPAAHEVIEIFQIAPHRRPLSLLRAPETSRTLAIARANEVRVDEDGGALVVTVAAPSQPLYAHGALRGAVAVATRIDLTPLTASLRASGIGADLLGVGEPVALTPHHAGDGAHTVTVPVPLGNVPADGAPPQLTLRASVRPAGGGALLAGRVLLVAAFLAALLTFVAHRARPMPTLDDAPTARRDTRTPRELYAGAEVTMQPNAPRLAMEPMPTAREKRGAESNRLVLAWSASMPTPITRLEPAQESAPIVIDPRGDQLAGRYRLLQPLGRGHSSDVYLAQSFVAGAPSTVALKILSAAASGRQGAFLAAARKQMRVAHPNVAQVLDVGDGGEVAYVAMEYVEGCTLELLLRDLFARDEPLPLPQTLAIMAALCRALDAARPLVHGAVKPSNVLVGRHNVVKLADFGAPPSASDRNAPEQYAGKTPDRRSDVYGAGVILHELVTGRRMEVGAAAGAEAGRWPALPAPSRIRPGLPRALDAVVAKATRFGPRGRYGAAGELLEALARASEEAIEGAQAGWLGDWVERARRSS